MNSRTKRFLLTATTLVVFAAFLWMRSLASWRPVSLGKIDSDYYLGAQERGVGLLSNDAQTLCVPPWDSLQVDVVDVRGKPIAKLQDFYPELISHKTTEWMFAFNANADNTLDARDLKSGRLEQTYHWPPLSQQEPNNVDNPTLLLSPDEKTLLIVDFPRVFQFAVQSGRLLHQVTLKHPFDSDSSFATRFSFSPDGTRLIGCYQLQGRTWRLPSGDEVNSWPTNASIHSYPDLFSPNARVVTYTCMAGDVTNAIFFIDTATGKTLWQVKNDIFRQQQFFGDELFVPQSSNCKVIDLFTGRTKRELSFPRQDDGFILRVTSDWIYTLNPKGEILRWRAR